MPNLHISLTSRNAGVNAITALFTATSKIRIYSNSTSQPSTPETAVPGGAVTLADINFGTTAWGTSTTGVATANGLPLLATILASGVAGWFRMFNGAGAALNDGTITSNAVGTGDMLFDNVNFVQSGQVSITDLTLTIPM